MVIRAELFPDELDRGYYGRLMRLNGHAKANAFDNLTARWAGASQCPLEIVSMLAGVPTETFVRQHTTIPFFEGVGNNWQATRPNDSAAYLKFLSTHSRSETRGEAYFCEECVALDLALSGQSYWRRSHQLPGIFWCPEHGSALRYVVGQAAFNRSPAELLPNSLANDAIWISEVRNNPAIKCYVELSLKVLTLREPLDKESVSNTLMTQARSQNYAVSAYGFSIDALLHEVVRQYGRRWLDTVMPPYRNRRLKLRIPCLRSGRYVEEVQRQGTFLLQSILACPILYGSAEEAFVALGRFNPGRATYLKPRPREFLRKTDELIAAYIHARGSYSKTQDVFRGKSASDRTFNGLRMLGLPNIEKVGDRNRLSALIAFFIDGHSFFESAAIGRIEHHEMENLLRRSGATIQRILKEIMTSIGDNEGGDRSA